MSVHSSHPFANYERERLQALRQLNLLDTPPSESFDRITRMAARLFNLPIAAVSLTDEDRQWFKSRVGVEHWEIPRERACCGEVADTTRMLVVNDLLESDTYRDSVLANSGIRFYAGAPLLTREGYSLGAMCVLGTEPRQATSEELAALQDLAAMVMAQIELQHAFGRIEPTTGLPNRSQFAEDLEDLGRDAPDDRRFAVFIELLDSQQISTVQRVMGQTVLDSLSRKVARFLLERLRPKTQVYQLGSCQYVYICIYRDEAAAVDYAVGLRHDLLALCREHDTSISIRPALGVSPFLPGSVEASDLLRTSHSACLDARQTEAGVGVFSMSIDAGHQRRFTLLADIRSALLSQDQLRLVFQPRIESATGRCVGAEALLRWRHPTLGDISPAEFIPLLENTPLARPITAWVMQAAIARSAIWNRQGRDLRISVNVSAANLDEDDFVDNVLATMRQHGLPSSALELELTESALIGNSRSASERLGRLGAEGITVAIDDFGTGYSSLAYLQEIPAHVVKIDRSFVSRLDTHARSQTLVRNMVSMAHDMGYRVVAEGVESIESRDFLHALGCEELQGYLIARPMSAEALEQWLIEREPD
ncbi:sensor domain-containing phosphodiesterase [Halopseudomonas nanhaiensis]|uniref:putative bifunctional diguanylate cyclase/phosphodiesterase n=1 Tax=Halopseudomonas nanhaiensis TaxID=2830842 RepID=UPI001CBFF704|nr:sensor domain-containing phosphodiesterase [Halopseudomonas nanhaiensis]UAW99741.1 sensor domain-containing phosphodiesterase [Halopseudomonas nanhaiensis]